jgi:Ca2+-transporting ATPase
MKERFYALTLEKVFELLGSSPSGLTEEEAEKRLKKYGYNRIEEEKESLFVIFFRQFNNPLVYILLFAMGITVYMGDKFDAAIIGGIVLINGLLGFFQEVKARASIRSLKKLTETKAKVIRDGKEKVITVSLIVPGDVVVLAEGDVVPADVRLIEATGLLVDESILTENLFR